MTKKISLRVLAIAFIALAVGATTSHAVLWSETAPDAVRPDRNSDPVEAQIRRETIARLPELRQKPAPFLRIDIPEPQETPRLIGLREQPADSSTPVWSTGTPPRPVLPLSAP